MFSVDSDIAVRNGREAAGMSDASLLRSLVVMARHRRLILGGMLVTAVLTAIIVLVIPATYTASTVILTSQNQSGFASNLLGELGPMSALAALGAGDSLFKSQADTFVGVLNSRTVADDLIQTFHLQSVYRKRTLVDTRKALARHTHVATTKGSFIRISVDDHDVHRAAAMANAYVDELYRVNQHLALTSAAQKRLFLEQQVSTEREMLTRAEEAFRDIQQRTGVIQLAGQQEMTLRSIAQLRAEISAKSVQIEQLRTMATEQNGQLQQLESGMSALQEQLRKAEGDSAESGGDYFVSAGRIPRAGLEYLRRLRDLRYHEALFEMLSKQYELARVEESKAPPIIQVLDKAIVLDKRSWPPRTLLVLLSLLTSGILLAGAVLLKDRWARAAVEPENAIHLNALRNLFGPQRHRV
jgi:tyrosine-protein kinase Etk/Wzc